MKIFVDRIFLKCLILISLLLFVTQSKSQIISKTDTDYPAGTTFSSGCPDSNCTITLPKVNFNSWYTITIPIDTSLPVDSFNISNINGSCTFIDDNHEISNTDNTIELIVTKRCHVSQSSNITFVLNAYYDSNIESQTFIVPIIRDTAKTVLTLDISGSMILPVQNGTGTRIDALKEAVNMLVPKLVDFGQEGDSLSLTYFSSNVIKDSPISIGFMPIESSPTNIADTVENDLNPRVPLQMTALGEGLLDAKNKLQLDHSVNLNRNVFLFTDGLQNWGNQVKELDGISFTQTNDSLNNYSANPKDSIRYFPVATWAASEHPELLQKIADHNNGEVIFVTPNTNLIIWFNAQLVNMLESGSPQIVISKSFNNYSGINSFTFNLNDHINKLMIELVADNSVKMSVYQGTTLLDSKARVISGDNFDILTYEFPIIDNPSIHSGGEWTIKLSGVSQTPVNLTVIADDHLLKYNCNINKDLYTVGDTIHFTTNLHHMGNILSGSNNMVQAIVIKPGEDLGDLLANYDTPEFNDSIIDMGSGADLKFEELMQNDSNFFNALLPEEQIVDLIDDGNGNYTGYFKETELAGIYNIIFLMNGEIPQFGKFNRTKTISSIIVFGQVEQDEPEVVDNPPASSSGNNNSNYKVFKIRPRNKFGKYMGPGFKSKIKVNINKKTIKPQTHAQVKSAIADNTNNQEKPYLQEIKDNLDGSYYLYIANLAPNSNPNIEIIVRDEILYEGKLYSTPIWYYVIAIIILVLLILIKLLKNQNTKVYKVLLWILIILWLILLILHRMGVLHVIS